MTEQEGPTPEGGKSPAARLRDATLELVEADAENREAILARIAAAADELPNLEAAEAVVTAALADAGVADFDLSDERSPLAQALSHKVVIEEDTAKRQAILDEELKRIDP